mgnify:CR=1 FL=1
MTILGIDWGEKNIGIAFSSGLVAAPFEILRVKNQEEAIEKIVRTCEELQAEKIVLGIPLDSEGREGNQARKVRAFGRKLGEEVGGEIVFWNESLSSKEALEKKIEAGRGRKSRRELDAVSAAVILQDFLDASP